MNRIICFIRFFFLYLLHNIFFHIKLITMSKKAVKKAAKTGTAVLPLAKVEPKKEVLVIDPQGVLQSKRYVKGATEFKTPAEILNPLLGLLGKTGGKLTLTGDHEATNANADKSKNVAYGRLNLVARYEIDTEIFYEVGVLVAFDLTIPRVKIYRGTKTRVCMNLSIFEAEDIIKFELGQGINFAQVETFLKDITKKIEETVKIINKLKSIKIPHDAVHSILGKMLMATDRANFQNGLTPILRAAELFKDDKSRYYYKQDNFNGWLLFNAFTEYYDKKIHFFDIPEKTRDTYILLKDICLQ
jgi:hypothetical protein